MIDLRIIIEKYPRSVGTRSQLASLLHDLYPSDKRSVNVAMIVYDSGIASKMAGLKGFDIVQQHGFMKQLVDEYGLQEAYAEEGIAIWAKAYNLIVPSSAYAPSVKTPSNPHATVHNPDAYAKPTDIVNGSASDYELEEQSHGVIIAKFRGFDEADVIIPNTIDGKKVVGIGKGAYYNCKVMKTLLISYGIEFIEDGAFANCENLSRVTFPTTLIRIGSIKEPNRHLTFSFRSDSMPTGAFAGSGVTKISLPDGLEILGDSSFKECKKLMSIDLPNGISAIEDNTFSGCSSLTKVILPERLSKLGKYVFNGCSKLYDVQFPLSLIEIGAYAFKGCSALTAVVLNEGLKRIGESAFNDCPKLAKILIPSTVSEIAEGYGYKVGDLFTINGWYQPMDRRRNGWSTMTKNPNLTIYCYSGSYGLEYARKKEYPIQNATNFSNN